MAWRPVSKPSFQRRRGLACARASIICLAWLCSSGRALGDDGVPGREDHAGRAVDGVDARGEDADGSEALDVEIDFRAFAAADPVALHGEDALGPAAFELGDVFQEFIGVGRGAEEPLFERALFHRGVFVTPAAAIDNLLIGEHGGAFGAPVDEGLFAVGESAFEHAEEEPLVPAIIIGLAGGDFAIPDWCTSACRCSE